MTTRKSGGAGTAQDSQTHMDTGLGCLVTIARLNGLYLDPGQLQQQFGRTSELDNDALLRAARQLGFRARSHRPGWKRLRRLPLPALARMRDGSCAVLAGMSGERILLQLPGARRAEIVSREFFANQWDGHIIELQLRARSDGETRFGLRWFLHTLRKYSRVMHEVIAASFFIQLFALVSPLVFMLVIDKVLSHRSLSTLDVLVFALAAVSLFDIVLSGLRSYLLSHTSHRIDVELGARLFRHLMSLQ